MAFITLSNLDRSINIDDCELYKKKKQVLFRITNLIITLHNQSS